MPFVFAHTNSLFANVQQYGEPEGDTIYYYAWGKDGDNNPILTKVESDEPYNIEVKFNDADNKKLSNVFDDLTQVGVNHSFVGIHTSGGTFFPLPDNGGAIYNRNKLGAINGDFVRNRVTTTTSDTVGGGAMYNIHTVGDVSGNFIANTSNNSGSGSSYGGAILNNYGNGTASTIGNITGYFEANGAISANKSASGGALNNISSNITNIMGSFSSNYVQGLGESRGGAISNFDMGDGDASIGVIEGNFTNNYVISLGADALGGAISNADNSMELADTTIKSITGDFVANYAQGKTAAYGGAVYNRYATTGDISGDFVGNFAKSEVAAYGGAVYNEYGTVNLIAVDSDTQFSGNYVEINGVKESNAIFNGMFSFYGNGEAVINMNAYGDKKIIVNDGIDGSASGRSNQIININNKTLNAQTFSTVEFNNSVRNQTVNVNAGVLKLGAIEAGSTTLHGTVANFDASQASLTSVVMNIQSDATLNIGTDVMMKDSSINFDSNSTLQMHAVGRDSYTQITLDGSNLAFNGQFELQLSNLDTWGSGNVELAIFNLINGASINASEAEVNLVYDTTKWLVVADTTELFTSGQLSISLDLIPEPSTATLSLLALAGLIARRRRCK